MSSVMVEHVWKQGGGAKLSFPRAKVCGGTPITFHVNTQSQGEGAKLRGEGETFRMEL